MEKGAGGAGGAKIAGSTRKSMVQTDDQPAVCARVWWCGGVVVWWCGGVVVWWCGGVVVWWCGVVWGRGGEREKERETRGKRSQNDMSRSFAGPVRVVEVPEPRRDVAGHAEQCLEGDGAAAPDVLLQIAVLHVLLDQEQGLRLQAGPDSTATAQSQHSHSTITTKVTVTVTVTGTGTVTRTGTDTGTGTCTFTGTSPPYHQPPHLHCHIHRTATAHPYYSHSHSHSHRRTAAQPHSHTHLQADPEQLDHVGVPELLHQRALADEVDLVLGERGGPALLDRNDRHPRPAPNADGGGLGDDPERALQWVPIRTQRGQKCANQHGSGAVRTTQHGTVATVLGESN